MFGVTRNNILRIASLTGLSIGLGGGVYFVKLLLSTIDATTESMQLTDFSTAYQVGEAIALLGLLMVTIALLFKIDTKSCEIISPKQLVFIAIFLIFCGLAYAVRMPLPAAEFRPINAVPYTVLNEKVQLLWLCLVGLVTCALSMLGILRIWPRTIMLLLMMYLTYFVTGIFLYNNAVLPNPSLFYPLLGFNALVFLLAFSALLSQRPEAEQALVEIEQLKRHKDRAKIEEEALKARLKARESQLVKSNMAQEILGMQRRPVELAKENALAPQSAAAPIALPAMATLLEPLHTGVSKAQQELDKLRLEIETLRLEYHNRETAHYQELNALAEKLNHQIKTMLLDKL